MQDIYFKIKKVLNASQKKSLIIIFFLILIGVIFEVLGIGMIIPLMNILVNNDLKANFPEFIPFLNLIGNPDQKDLIIISLTILLIVYALKNIFLSYLTWKKSEFTFSLFANLSSRLLKIYLNKEYNFYVERNSADLIRNILNETRHFGKGFILSCLDTLVEFLVLIAIIILLIFIEPFSAICLISIFSLIGVIYFLKNRAKLKTYGTERQFFEGKKLKYLNEIFDNIKIISLLAKDTKLVKNFDVGNAITADIGKKQNFIQHIPKYFFEFIAIFLFCLFVYFFLSKNNYEINNLIPTLAIFTAATFRILPSINKILVKFQTIRFSKPAIDLIYNDFLGSENISKIHKKTINVNFIELSFKNIYFKYKRDKDFLLKDINLKIESGKTYGFIGPSGVGKSTFMDLFMCLQKPSKGEIILNSDLNVNENSKIWQNIIGYVPQNVFLTDDTIKNNIAFGEDDEKIDEYRLHQSLKFSQLEKFVNNQKNKIDTVVGENGLAISGGQKQRIGIARALYLNPQILVLDEVTSSLDLKTEEKIIDDLNTLKGKKTILMITHRSSTIKHCDEIFKFENNRLKKI